MIELDELEEQQRTRNDLLKLLYELSGGKANRQITFEQIRNRPAFGALGADPVRGMIAYWAQKKFVKAIGKLEKARLFFVQPAGISYVEKELMKGA